MDFAAQFKQIVQACTDHPLLVALGALAAIVSIYIMFDAHRNKKNRARHRWK